MFPFSFISIMDQKIIYFCKHQNIDPETVSGLGLKQTDTFLHFDSDMACMRKGTAKY